MEIYQSEALCQKTIREWETRGLLRLNNEGLHVVCQSCVKRIVETLAGAPVILTISNLKTFEGEKCTIEDGLLGGLCGNDGRFLVSIQADKRMSE